MIHEVDFVAAYRNRAEHIRARAESADTGHARSDLLRIAADYEKMAVDTERAQSGTLSDEDNWLLRSEGRGCGGIGKMTDTPTFPLR
jgi:hypothetical protein